MIARNCSRPGNLNFLPLPSQTPTGDSLCRTRSPGLRPGARLQPRASPTCILAVPGRDWLPTEAVIHICLIAIPVYVVAPTTRPCDVSPACTGRPPAVGDRAAAHTSVHVGLVAVPIDVITAAARAGYATARTTARRYHC